MSNTPFVAGKEFVAGYRQQDVWQSWIALAFFFGKIGSGIFILSLFLGSPMAAIVGLVLENVGKGGALLIHLGRPERFWRALSRPQTSWIARTVWAMGIFTAIAVIYLLLPEGSTAWHVFRVLAGIFAIIVAVSDGFVVNASPAIPLWNTAMMPFLFLLYSLLAGTTVYLFMTASGLVSSVHAAYLEHMEIALIIVNLIAVLIYLLSISNSSPAARQSLQLLIKGTYAGMFYGLVILVGFVLTLLMLLLFASSGSALVVGITAAADLIGHFFIFYLLLKTGVYAPPTGTFSI